MYAYSFSVWDMDQKSKTEQNQKMSRLMTKTNKLTCSPSEDSDQPGHPPSLIRVVAVRSMGS